MKNLILITFLLFTSFSASAQVKKFSPSFLVEASFYQGSMLKGGSIGLSGERIAVFVGFRADKQSFDSYSIMTGRFGVNAAYQVKGVYPYLGAGYLFANTETQDATMKGVTDTAKAFSTEIGVYVPIRRLMLKAGTEINSGVFAFTAGIGVKL